MKTYNLKINGKEYSVEIKGIEGKNADVSVNGVPYNVELEDSIPAAIGNGSVPSASFGSAPAGSNNDMGANTAGVGTAAVSSGSKAAPAGACITVKSPLPGVIISIDVKEGQTVSKGQKVAVLEAMKMENEIQAEADGTVTAILVQKGDSVLEGAEILKIA